MSETVQASPQFVESAELRSQAQILPLESEALPKEDELSQRLAAAGVSGEPVADIEAGGQRFAILNLSRTPYLISGVNKGNYQLFESSRVSSDKSPEAIELDSRAPYALVHLANDGTITGRALRPGTQALIGRTAAAEDSESKRFEAAYAADRRLSRRHFSVAMSEAGDLAITDLGSANGTYVRYNAGLTPRMEQTAPRTIEEVSPDAVLHAAEATQTQALLEHSEFMPADRVEAGGRTFLLSSIFRSQNGREHAIMYTEIESDGRKLVAPRMLYKSNSDGGWRVAYGYEKWDSRYVKEAHEDGFAHYTQETKLAPEILDGLDRATVTEDLNGVLTQDVKRIFTTGTPEFRETNTGAAEISYHKDTAIDQVFQPARAVSAGLMDKDTLSHLHNGGYISFSQFIDNGVNPAIEKIPGFVPNFAAAPQATTRRNHTLLGSVTIEDYPAAYNGTPVVWSMARDSQGRVWIDNIRLRDAKISSYGTYATVFDGGILTSKPLEYHAQADGLARYEAVPFDKRYDDITPVLSNLLPIKQYINSRVA